MKFKYISCFFYSLVVLTHFISCSSENKYHILDIDITHLGKEYHDCQQKCIEYIVMTHPSDSHESRFKDVKFYLESRIHNKNLSKDLIFYKAFFFKESWQMPVDYNETAGFFDNQVVSDHLDDLIVTVTYKNGVWAYKVKTENNPDKWIVF